MKLKGSCHCKAVKFEVESYTPLRHQNVFIFYWISLRAGAIFRKENMIMILKDLPKNQLRMGISDIIYIKNKESDTLS